MKSKLVGKQFFSGANISLNKTLYAAGERIVVDVSGITQQMVDDEAWVAIYKAGAAHTDWGVYAYVEVGAGQVELTAPDEKGAYEMRLYRKDHEYTDATFVMKVAFEVGSVSVANPGKIALEKDSYLANSKISIKISGITQKMENDGSFLAIYRKGAKHNEWGTYDYPKAGESTIELTAPNLNGDFEVRLYTEDHFYSDATFVMSVPFKLSGATTPNTSRWALGEIEQAEALGLIPDSLKKAELTKPITREEFAELSVKLYEKSTGQSPVPTSPSPFTDTINSEVLKALKLGITTGTSDTTFSPQVLINREQCATMLFRAIKAIEPDGDYSVVGIPDFPDQANISSYAEKATKYMSKMGIIKGDTRGYFMPAAITAAEKAVEYGMATREAAILMSVRTYEKLDSSK